jgi:hypothetical protein
MEKQVDAIFENLCNIELLGGIDASGHRCYGVRIRPYGKGADTQTMVLGKGSTLEEAIQDGHDKAKAGRFERLDWAKRPWAVGQATTGWGPRERPQFAQESATGRAKRRWEATEGDNT